MSSPPISPAFDSFRPKVPSGDRLSSTDGTDRVFPIRSLVAVDPTSASANRPQQRTESVQVPQRGSHVRRNSVTGVLEGSEVQKQARRSSMSHGRPDSPTAGTSRPSDTAGRATATAGGSQQAPPKSLSDELPIHSSRYWQSAQILPISPGLESPSARSPSVRSAYSSFDEDDGHFTSRYKHIVTESGHAMIVGRGGGPLQRCEDELIHIPGAVQGFGLLIALRIKPDGKLSVRIVSENAQRLIGYNTNQLFALESFTDILSESQTDEFLDHIDFIQDDGTDVARTGPEVFPLVIEDPEGRQRRVWCAIHMSEGNQDLILCEFELEDDHLHPLLPSDNLNPEAPIDTLQSNPSPEDLAESTTSISQPLRILRSARNRRGEAAAMQVFSVMSQVQEQLACAPNLQSFLKILVGVVKELTGFHRVMIYQFDQNWNGKVVTELVDPAASKDLYYGLNFPASDIPSQARELYRINRVRLLYDRDQETARLVCRTLEDLETPVDLTHSYLRAISPIHLQYLKNMGVRSTMSISINAFNELWGLIACHCYGPGGMRVSFPIRKMCRLVGDMASRNIERLSYASRLQARKLINTVPTAQNASGYIVATSDDLLKLFNADFGILSIQDETKILGNLEQPQEVLAMLEYLRMRKITSVTSSQDITEDFPDLRYTPGFAVIAGMLLVPLSVGGNDFIVFFRKEKLREIKWAGNPYESKSKAGTESFLQPRQSFKMWGETVFGKSREWTEEEIETAAVLCLVYGKFIEVWRQKEAALQSSQLTRLLLANSAHEVRTPLNAIVNYLEIALEGSLDPETREYLTKSHSASKSLIYVINDLLDLTKIEKGGELVSGETFDLRATLNEISSAFEGEAKRKGLAFSVTEHDTVPYQVIGDQRKIHQAISNVVANAIGNTSSGYIKVETYLAHRFGQRVEVEVAVEDSGVGMDTKRLDELFMDLEQVQADETGQTGQSSSVAAPESKEKGRKLGLGLAVVARIIRNLGGQLRLKSEEGKGSRFVLSLPFDLAEPDQKNEMPGPSAGFELPQTPGEQKLTSQEVKNSFGDNGAAGMLSRNHSGDSTHTLASKRSIQSFHSAKSGRSSQSGKSDVVDRLIDAIKSPHMVQVQSPPRGRSTGSRSGVPTLERTVLSHAESPRSQSPARRRMTNFDDTSSTAPNVPAHIRAGPPSNAGQQSIIDSGVPLSAVKVTDDTEVEQPATNPLPDLKRLEDAPHAPESSSSPSIPTELLRILVAEDDLINSKILKKRLEKTGHDIHLTVNGEDCAAAYSGKASSFDVVLMDMQMPIVDGLSSTKMIRSFERRDDAESPPRRIPIIAVSASLVERDKQVYVDAGFDGWILKPISFPRLNELLTGINDPDTRVKSIYVKGEWERGGWFSEDLQQPPSAIKRHKKPRVSV